MKRFVVEAHGNTSVTDGAVVRFTLTANSAEEALALVGLVDAEGTYERLEVISEDDLPIPDSKSVAPASESVLGVGPSQKKVGPPQR